MKILNVVKQAETILVRVFKVILVRWCTPFGLTCSVPGSSSISTPLVKYRSWLLLHKWSRCINKRPFVSFSTPLLHDEIEEVRLDQLNEILSVVEVAVEDTTRFKITAKMLNLLKFLRIKLVRINLVQGLFKIEQESH